MESRTKKSKINIFYGILSKIVTLLLEFISRFVFIKYLGAELLGVNGVFTNVIQCLSLAELGMNNVVMFSYYEPLANNNTRKLSALNAFYKKVYNTIAVSVTMIGLCIIPLLKYIINTDYAIPHLYLIYLLFLIDTVVSYLCVYKVTILNADQNGYISSQYDIIFNSLRTICQMASLFLLKNFLIYLAIKIIFSALSNILKAKKVDKDYEFTQTTECLSTNEKSTIFNTIKSGFIYKISAVLMNSTDNMLISSIVGTIWVGLLSNYVTLCTSVTSFVVIIFNNLTASIGNLVATESKEKRLQIFEVMSMMSNWIAFVCFICTLILCNDFIRLWLGGKYVLEQSIVLPKVMMLYVSCVMQPIFSYREALGLYVKTKYVMLLSAILNIVLSIIMGIVWGTAGILIASLISVGVTYFWYEPTVLYKDYFNDTVNKYFRRIMTNIVICFITTVILGKVSILFSANGWITLVIKGFLLFVIVNVECFFIYGRTDEFKFLLSKIRREK